MSVVAPVAAQRTVVEARLRDSLPLPALPGTGASATHIDAVTHARVRLAAQPSVGITLPPPRPARLKPSLRDDLEALRRQLDGEQLYRRAIEDIATEIRIAKGDRVPHARDVLESLRDPDAEDGRGQVAADVYQRIEPASRHTLPGDAAGRLTPEERARLGVNRAVAPPAAAPGVGGPTWSRALSAYDNQRIDVALPNGATDYFSYKPYRYGTARTIETIKRVAERYHQATGMLLRVGDIAARNGGRIPDHASHTTGKIFDLDLAFDDGRSTAEPDRDSVNASWRSPAYDRNATRKLITIIKAIRPGAQILFNDPVLVREGLVRAYPNHDNHLHVQHLS